jgi:Rad3-related DNA helicase
MKPDRPKTPEQHLDVRVRDRLIASGTLDPKVLETHLAELPDLDARAETIPIEQPALSPRESE